MRQAYAVAAAASVIISLALFLPSPTGATTGDERVIVDAPISGPAWTETGAWRSKIQQVFDARTRTLTRRFYEVWDPEPSRDLDFVWTPERPETDRPGRINGSGHLVWRLKELPSYDRESVFAEYRGTIRNGRVEGRGAYLDKAGLLYEGEWRGGLMHGHGTLKLPSGDEYVGKFLYGKAHGAGRYIDITGEVYEGRFVDGYRHGRGTTTLPNGVRYASVWVAGKEVEDSYRVRLAQSGGRGVPGGADDIRLGISVNRRLPPPRRGQEPRIPEGDLWYSIANTSTGLSLRPDNKRLMSMWKGAANIQLTKGEEIGDADSYGIFSLSRGQLVPLTLNLELQNRSRRPIQVIGTYVDVRSSMSDLQPAVQLRSGASLINYSYRNEFKLQLTLENFGWSPARSATLRYSIVPPPGSASGSSPQVTRSIGQVQRTAIVDLSSDLAARGIDVAYLRAQAKTGIPCTLPEARVCLESRGEDGKFADECKPTPAKCLAQYRTLPALRSVAALLSVEESDVFVTIAGSLDYTWTDVKGTSHQRSSPFRSRVHLGFIRQEFEAGEGGERQIISSRPVHLRLDAANYRLPLSVRANVSSGRASRFALPLKAEKASSHEFSIVFQLSDGREIRSRTINLLYFTPSWFK